MMMSENANELEGLRMVAEQPRRRTSFPILILAILFVSATCLTWYFTWFGRELNDAEITRYLSDQKNPRHVQHALLQIQERLEQRTADARQWYPTIVALAKDSETEYRLTAAWIMGFDNRATEFHQTLLQLLHDNEPLVRQNAALALIRFNDPNGRDVLLATLKPYSVTTPASGTVSSTLNEGAPVSRGTLLVRIRQADDKVFEVRSPMPGRIDKLAIGNGSKLASGDVMLTIDSDANSIWEALRGLALIGQAADLDEIGRYAKGVDSLPARIREQAALTARAISIRQQRLSR
jgi:hypothetical protein